MQSQVSYSEIQVNGKYKLNNKEIIIKDKHLAMITSSSNETSRHEERIIYYYVDDTKTDISTPFKDLEITY
jgi:hypothetical protein